MDQARARTESCAGSEVVEQLPPEPWVSKADVNAALAVSMLGPVVPYSSEVQQPMRAMAILNGHLHMWRAAPLEREQGCAGSLHLWAESEGTLTSRSPQTFRSANHEKAKSIKFGRAE